VVRHWQTRMRRTLGLGVSADDVGVRSDGRLHLRVIEVDDGAVVLEEVNLLNGGDVVHAKAFQRVLQPLVICCGGLVDRLLLPTNRALATRAHLRRHFCELFGVHDCYCCCFTVSLGLLPDGRRSVLGGCEYLLRRKTTGRRVSSASGWATAQISGWLGGRAQATTPLSRNSAAARKCRTRQEYVEALTNTRVSWKEETPRTPYVVEGHG